ncbi:50S ribosomal protein L11 methyltransferase [Phytohabitans flavus]|uniref:50S ribosomal protein L11 methyltransferase n=1 Tax=Phytohabitans flavus TaxID=1076124 RepID=UPI003633FCE8
MAKPGDIPFTVDLHMRLLLSLDRGHSVQRAVAAAVRPGARVLDAGTGSGLLSFVALAAGAGEAVAVDRHHVEMARTLAAHNGLTDRMTVVEGDLSRLELSGVDLTRPFDLLLAFIHVNNPLVGEDRARVVYEVRDRFCAADCTVLPEAVRYRAVGCDRLDWDLPTELADLGDAAGILRGAYGLDFQPLVDATKQGVARSASRPESAVRPQWRSPRRWVRSASSRGRAGADREPRLRDVRLHRAGVHRISARGAADDRHTWAVERGDLDAGAALRRPVGVDHGVVQSTCDTPHGGRWRRGRARHRG